MKRKLLYLLILIAGVSEAQQLPHFSQYMINDFVMNPAVGGSRDYVEGKSNNRYQWVGITDAPRTYILSLHGPTKNRKMGIGGYLYTDITGPTRRTGLDLTYSYHLKLSDKIKLSFGVAGGLLQFAVDGSKITVKDEGDIALSSGLQSVIVPDFSAGFYLYSKKFYVGASAPQMLKSKLQFFDYQTSSRLSDHYYAMAGYHLKITEDFEFEPSVLVKYVKPAPLQYDVGGRFNYKGRVWIGGAYRNLDAFTGLVGFTWRNLLFGYSYDFTTSNLKNYSTGTHEVMIGVKFSKEEDKASTPSFN